MLIYVSQILFINCCDLVMKDGFVLPERISSNRQNVIIVIKKTFNFKVSVVLFKFISNCDIQCSSI